MEFDYVIVGSGITGCTIAETLANKSNNKILVIEKRNHIGGNIYDYYNDEGILVHKYGPHIFHTNNKRIWDYLSKFTEWNLYNHKVLGYIDGTLAPIPFNINTLYRVFPIKLANNLEEILIRRFGYGNKITILQLRKENDGKLQFLANFIYEKIFLNYTAKQWSMKPEDLDVEVMNRVPIVISRDDRYFHDKYQGIPKSGYTNMLKKMLKNKNIYLLMNTDYKEVINGIKYKKLIYTAPADYFFDYKYGKLEYISLDFKFETYYYEKYQPVATINYPNEYEFTRITEFKHMTNQEHKFTTIVKEYPKKCVNEYDIPCYPVLNSINLDIYRRYKLEIDNMYNTIFIGRLAEYRYINIDQAIERALKLADNI
jgi:UDP-galactopyranose mutase